MHLKKCTPLQPQPQAPQKVHAAAATTLDTSKYARRCDYNPRYIKKCTPLQPQPWTPQKVNPAAATTPDTSKSDPAAATTLDTSLFPGSPDSLPDSSNSLPDSPNSLHDSPTSLPDSPFHSVSLFPPDSPINFLTHPTLQLPGVPGSSSRLMWAPRRP